MLDQAYRHEDDGIREIQFKPTKSSIPPTPAAQTPNPQNPSSHITEQCALPNESPPPVRRRPSGQHGGVPGCIHLVQPWALPPRSALGENLSYVYCSVLRNGRQRSDVLASFRRQRGRRCCLLAALCN